MEYTKPPLTITQQIELLESRGLIIKDRKAAERYLSNISYYRLRAYTYPFQHRDGNQHFRVRVAIEEIVALYQFDHKLRMIFFDALEKIEISFRTQIIHQWAVHHGSHWHLNEALFRNKEKHTEHLQSLQKEVERSKETFIKHYHEKYSSPESPPAWMSLEIVSLGLLSQIFSNLKKGSEKTNIQRHYGLKKIEILENWMWCFTNVRNICAHHSRLWSQRLPSHITLPRKVAHPSPHAFIRNKNVLPYKIYPVICCAEYLLRQIADDKRFYESIHTLMESCPREQEKAMGFPSNWRSESFWCYQRNDTKKP